MTGESQWEAPEDIDAVEPEAQTCNGFRSPTSVGSPSSPTSPTAASSFAAANGRQPKSPGGSNRLFIRRLPDPDGVQKLMDMGFGEDDAVTAMLACGNDVNRACNVLTTKRPQAIL